MGRRGPPQAPTVLRLLRGCPDKRPVNKAEPQSLPSASAPPAGMSKAAAETWRETFPILANMRVMTQADRQALRLYCETWARWLALDRYVDTVGVAMDTPEGHKLRPEVGALQGCRSDLIRLMDRFGFVPSARRGLTAAPTAAGSLASFIAERKKKKT